MAAPSIAKAVPAQVINEQAAFGPFDLTEYIESDDPSPLTFQGELEDGSALPKGIICTEDGILTGIPARDTKGNYMFRIIAQNEAGSVEMMFPFSIKPSMVGESVASYMDQLKSQVWDALEHKLPVPDLGSLYDRPITIQDIYYILERFATLTIWDALNLEAPGDKQLMQLEGTSSHFNIYDRGSCLVATPKDLYSHERTLADALQTAKAMAREVYKRGWIIEFAGFEKMERAAWVEIQHQEDIHGKKLEILHYDPTFKELRIYTEEAKEYALKRAEQR